LGPLGTTALLGPLGKAALLGPSGTANLNTEAAVSKGPNRVGASSFQDQVSETLFPSIWNSGRYTKSRNVVILNVIHPLDSKYNA
jgi:hypothetical protein